MLCDTIKLLGGDGYLQRLGRPRYRVGMRVFFYHDGDREAGGTIVGVNVFGTKRQMKEVSYQIIAFDGRRYRDIPESEVERL